jgi:phosphoglycerate dehydrogenase-like enzyme
MKVTVIRQRPTSSAEQTLGITFETTNNLTKCLAEANVLLITCPLTEQTRGMIGQAELRSMPSGSILVNVGRGAVVDQAALYQALVDGHLAAAGLDVWYNYPETDADRSHTAPADFPFHQLDQVIMSPHRGGLTRETEQLRMEHLADLLNSLANAEELPPRVDVVAGY